MRFGAVLREARLAAGLSLEDLADQASNETVRLHASAISRWERGDRYPRQQAPVVALEDALRSDDLVAVWLAGLTDAPVTESQEALFESLQSQIDQLRADVDELLGR